MNKNLCLVGPMGAGKTTIGKKLAAQFNADFIDCDDEIESRTGTTIPVIFDIEGEEGFRDREEKILEELIAKKGLVLATGGGCVIREANRIVLKNADTVIYLAASVQDQLARTRKSRHRPLLDTPDKETRLTQLAEQRDPLYEEVATIVVHSHGRKASAVVKEIIELLGSDFFSQ